MNEEVLRSLTEEELTRKLKATRRAINALEKHLHELMEEALRRHRNSDGIWTEYGRVY